MQSRYGNRYPHCSASPLPPTARRGMLEEVLRGYSPSLFSYLVGYGLPHTCKVFTNGRMLLHLAPSLIERIKEIDANDPYPKQSKLRGSLDCRISILGPVDCM